MQKLKQNGRLSDGHSRRSSFNDADVPTMLMQFCDCGKPNCPIFLLAMINPQHTTIEGKKGCPYLHVPPEVQLGLVGKIFELWQERNPEMMEKLRSIGLPDAPGMEGVR